MPIINPISLRFFIHRKCASSDDGRGLFLAGLAGFSFIQTPYTSSTTCGRYWNCGTEQHTHTHTKQANPFSNKFNHSDWFDRIHLKFLFSDNNQTWPYRGEEVMACCWCCFVAVWLLFGWFIYLVFLMASTNRRRSASKVHSTSGGWHCFWWYLVRTAVYTQYFTTTTYISMNVCMCESIAASWLDLVVLCKYK